MPSIRHVLRKVLLPLLPCLLAAAAHAQQYKLRGTVADVTTGETLIGANVVLKGTTIGTVTDIDGRFELLLSELPPCTLVVSYIGYTAQEVVVKSLDKELKLKLALDQVLLGETEVVGSRISEKQKQAPLTVESMDIIGIREAPSGDFYESLGTLKGVDMTAASMGFKVINTRGFNSTSPVRSLQLIDGVDNQSPGLNFSLGNFLGASDLDVMKVDVIAGASTAYYGPGAFNGVVAMTTKSPWAFPGLSVSAKAGERDLLEGAVRWAQVFKDKDGKQRFAYKLNVFGMRAEDWFAEDYGPTSDSPTGVDNPGRYDGVNSYGDENVTVNNDFSNNFFDRRTYPGLGHFLRPGYREVDLVDYGTDNLKAGVSLHYKVTDSVEVIAAANYSTGSTVYQGENRYRLDGVQFWQQRLELRREGKWFIRGYFTGEDAGSTYDIFTTGVRLQEAAGTTQEWNIKYFTLWETWIRPLLNATQPGYLTPSEAVAQGITSQQAYDAYLTQFVNDNSTLFTQYHQAVADSIARIDNNELNPAYIVGTQRFTDKLNEIRGKRFTEGGSLFFDRSQLAHAMGEYRFKPAFGEVAVGGSFRQYMPNSAGTIFRDTGDVVIRNSEFGVYSGLEKKLMADKLKLTATLRLDKNQNFRALLSPALSFVYTPRQDRTFRIGFSSAVRNPTLADQYLYYNVGRAILLGNVDGQFEAGRDSLITVESFNAYRSSPTLLEGLSKLDYFNVDRLRPEQVRTIEAGYRGTHAEKFYIDASAYHSWYTDFIGYLIGLSARFDQTNGFPLGGLQAYRLAANASTLVRTQGANVGISYFRKRMTYGVNYSYNELVTGSDDPIIPAFNTPRNKFNLSFTGHDMKVPFSGKPNLGFGINWKYVEGFTFTGSPQFTGPIPSYDMVDAQVNVKFPGQHLTVKLGASNLFGLTPLFDADIPSGERLDRVWDNRVRMVYGGPFVGRLAYLQLIYELDRR
ncbi:MAG: carboxypeptidase-like regulatory domain-containing protein [Flavobacteriales bacterium]|nr:MAG: carboxypeptidase-like regulatory domain-containing protein [Flavobacteriales bacterium]